MMKHPILGSNLPNLLLKSDFKEFIWSLLKTKEQTISLTVGGQSGSIFLREQAHYHRKNCSKYGGYDPDIVIYLLQ